ARRARTNAALCHRRRGLDCPRGHRLARRAPKDALMASPDSQPAAPATALILVDVVNSFFVAGMPTHYPEASAVLEPLRQLLAAARATGRIVVHAVERHYPGFDDYEWRKLPQHHFIGDADAAFVDGFSHSGPREIVWVIVAGIKTNVCIRATAQDAFAHGFDVIVPREATNSNRPHLAAASLEDIERYFGAVVSLDRALEMLT